MKKTLLILFTLFASINLWAQAGTTVNYGDNFGPLTLSYNGTVNTKHSYQGAGGGATVTISWSGTAWEIYINVGSGDDLSFSSATTTSSNPPDFSIGNWQDVNAGDGTTLTSLSGTGTTSIALPVELVGFYAEAINNSVFLKWMTASEKNNLGFEVQRSIDAENYETLTFVEGNGTTYEATSYQYEDKVLRQETYYYRLKQIDFDGQFEYSDIITIELSDRDSDMGNFYPNPTNGLTRLNYTARQNTSLSIQVYSITGQLLHSENRSVTSGNSVLSFNFSNLPSGTVFIKLSENGNDAVYKKCVIK